MEVTSQFRACIRKEDNGFAAFHYSPYVDVASGYGRTESEAIYDLVKAMYGRGVEIKWEAIIEEN